MASSSRFSEGTSYSGLSSSSTCSSSSSSFMSSYTAAMAADHMVKVEIEAAEALADLSVLAVRESVAQPSEIKWGIKRKGKRTKKEVKTESPTSGFLESLPSRVDPDLRIEDRGVVSHQPSKKQCTNQSHPEWETTRKMLKADKEEVESLKVSPTCTTSYPLFGCKRSRRNLTEAEKEERRVRRVLANRESARQTIRRRQALCEELTKKAADLAWENESLKREKEVALKEYQSLETTNKELKEQMAQAVKPKVEKIPGNNGSSHVHMPPLPTNYPFFLFSHPPYPSYFWPPVVQPSSPYHELHNVAVVPQSINFPANNNVPVSDSSHVQENFTNVNGLRTPFCILPRSWLLPHHDHSNQQSPQILCPTGNNQEDVYSNSQNSAYTSMVVVGAENRHSSFPSAEEKNEAPYLNEAPNLNEALNPKDHTQNTVGVVVEGFDADARAQVREVLSPVRLECIEPSSAVKQDNQSKDDHGLSSRTYDNLCGFAEKKQEPETAAACKKTIDAMAAAEARRRRKELTKLKNLHTRQCRMHS